MNGWISITCHALQDFYYCLLNKVSYNYQPNLAQKKPTIENNDWLFYLSKEYDLLVFIYPIIPIALFVSLSYNMITLC